MAPANSGIKKKLMISACDVARDGSVSVDTGNSFEVMLNPSDLSHDFSIRYNETDIPGQLSKMKKFDGINSEKVGFKLILDGTGVVTNSDSAKSAEDVKTQVQKLTDIIYKYDGNKHEPNHVRLLWGSFLFYGRLESLNFKYTLFKPSGEPLRAEANIKFTGFMTPEEEALQANRSSPDLTHVIQVKSGDTLPALCQRIYNDPLLYLAVAKINKLNNFRKLKPGTRLVFPPLG